MFTLGTVHPKGSLKFAFSSSFSWFMGKKLFFDKWKKAFLCSSIKAENEIYSVNRANFQLFILVMFTLVMVKTGGLESIPVNTVLQCILSGLRAQCCSTFWVGCQHTTAVHSG